MNDIGKEMLVDIIMNDEGYEKIKDLIDWEYISSDFYQELTPAFIEKFSDNINWEIITMKLCEYYKIEKYFDIKFVEKYVDKLNWHIISTTCFKDDSGDFLSDYEKYIYFKEIPAITISYLSLDSIQKYETWFDISELRLGIVLHILRFRYYNIDNEYLNYVFDHNMIDEEYEEVVRNHLSSRIFQLPITFIRNRNYLYFNPKLFDYDCINSMDTESINEFLWLYIDRVNWEEVVRYYSLSLNLIKKYIYRIYPYRKTLLTTKFVTYSKKERRKIKRIFRKEKIKQLWDRLK